jgi:hypothetical protein
MGSSECGSKGCGSKGQPVPDNPGCPVTTPEATAAYPAPPAMPLVMPFEAHPGHPVTPHETTAKAYPAPPTAPPATLFEAYPGHPATLCETTAEAYPAPPTTPPVTLFEAYPSHPTRLCEATTEAYPTPPTMPPAFGAGPAPHARPLEAGPTAAPPMPTSSSNGSSIATADTTNAPWDQPPGFHQLITQDFEASHPLTRTMAPHLLTVVVQSSSGHLDAKYSSFKEAGKLIKETPGLFSLLELSWETEAYGPIFSLNKPPGLCLLHDLCLKTPYCVV